MPRTGNRASRWASADWLPWESTIAEFEQVWQSGQPPAIEDYLPATEPERSAVLRELVFTDLEYRLQSGLPARVETYLESYPGLADEQTFVLELITAEWELRGQRDTGLCAEEYFGRFPQYAPDLRRQLLRAKDAPPGHSDSTPRNSAEPTDANEPGVGDVAKNGLDIPGYEILEKLGTGGMGVVYKARHIALNRFVALKMVWGGVHADAEQRHRFRMEAEAVARLQHPNIVQIHEVGDVNGQPFLALEYVGGGTLASYLGGKPQEPVPAAQIIASLAQAMHFAHEHGIVHRDLKPANILLVSGGVVSREWSASSANTPRLSSRRSPLTTHQSPLTNPKVTDFGLAKLVTEGGAGDAGHTQTGSILGTPSYMAPEQASGKTKEIGPAADTYALGAILYEMLTGRPPFQAPTILETLEQVRSQEPVPPSRLQPRVPRDLGTICLKCLFKEPRKRYASANDLAEDLSRFLEGRPIQARPAGGTERVWRWCRRNPLVTALVGLVAVTLTGGLAGVIWEWQNARQAAASEHQMVLEARGAVNRFFTVVTESQLADAPGFQPLRKELLENALGFYRRLLERRGNDPASLGDFAAIHFRIAQIHYTLEANDEALAALDRGLDLVDQLALTGTDLSEFHRQLAGWSPDMRRVHRGSHPPTDVAGAQRILQRAAGTWEAFVQANPDNPSYRRTLAAFYAKIGELHHSSELAGDAVVLLERAREIAQKLADEHPGVAVYRADLADNLALIGMFYGRRSPFKAEEPLRRALEIHRQLASEFPDVSYYRQRLAIDHETLARALPADRVTEAEEHFASALKLFANLAGEFPTTLTYREDLATCHVNRALYLSLADRPIDAVIASRTAVALQEKIVADFPNARRSRYYLALTYLKQGRSLLRDGKLLEGEEAFKKAISHYRPLADEFPNVPEYQDELVAALRSLAGICNQNKQHNRALDLAQESLVRARRALERIAPQAEPIRFRNLFYASIGAMNTVGEYAQAAQGIPELPRLFPENGTGYYYAAHQLEQCIRGVREDAGQPESERARLAGTYADQATAMLTLLLRGNHKEAARIRQDPWPYLRDREDFKKLRAELDVKDKPRDIR